MRNANVEALLVVGLLCSALLAAGSPLEVVKPFYAEMLSAIPTANGETVVAVIPFDDAKSQSGYGIVLAEVLVSSIMDTEKLTVVERADFDKILMEQEFSHTDLAEPATVIETGKLLSASYLITGRVADAFGKVTLTVKVLTVKTGEVTASKTTTLQSSALKDIEKKLFSERNQVVSSTFRSLLLPGWGQLYSGQPVRGIVSFVAAGTGAVLAATGISGSVTAHNEHEDYALHYMYSNDYLADLAESGLSAGDFEAQAMAEEDALLETYYEKHDKAVLFGIICGGLWLLNCVDASIAGVQQKKAFRPYFAWNSGAHQKEIQVGIWLQF